MWTLLAVVATGFASEVLHYARLELHRFGVYYVHLLLVFVLLMYLPYSKFAHMIYRTTALVYADHSGRKSQALAEAAATAPAAAEVEAPAPEGTETPAEEADTQAEEAAGEL